MPTRLPQFACYRFFSCDVVEEKQWTSTSIRVFYASDISERRGGLTIACFDTGRSQLHSERQNTADVPMDYIPM